MLILKNGSPFNDLLSDPLAQAYRNNNMVIFEDLLKVGADIQKIYPDLKMTLGDIAKKRNDTEVVALIKKYGGRFTK